MNERSSRRTALLIVLLVGAVIALGLAAYLIRETQRTNARVAVPAAAMADLVPAAAVESPRQYHQ